MTERPATEQEVRKHYEADGYEVRIDDEGHVEYRRDSDDEWLEGRWVSEYRYSAEHGVRLT